MHCSRLFASAAALLATSACTHLETTTDTRTGEAAVAAIGIPYALPQLEYKMVVSNSITSCPRIFHVTSRGQEIAFSDGAFALSSKIEATPSYVAGERFVADYRTLVSPFKTSSYAIELNANGVLKSINVAAEDKSGPLISSLVSVGLSLVGLGVPVPFVGGRTFSQNFRPDTLDEALAKFSNQPQTTFLGCSDSTAEQVGKLNGSADELETATADLTAATRNVARLTTITANRHGTRGDLMKLDKALKAQARAEAKLADVTDSQGDAKKKLSATGTKFWRPAPDLVDQCKADSSCWFVDSVSTSNAAKKSLAGMTEVLGNRIIDKRSFISWWHSYDGNKPVQRGFLKRYPEIAKAYGVDQKDVPQMVKATPINKCESSDSGTCVTPLVTYPARMRLVNAARIVRVEPKDQIRNDKVAPGIFVRSTQRADIQICRRAPPDGVCATDDVLIEEDGVSMPQFGQLRFLPFRNRMFEASELTLALRDDGTIEKFEYKSTKALATEAAAAAKDAVDQYAAFRDKQDKKATDSVTAARAEEIASIQHQIDVLNKQKELTKAQAPDAPDAEAAIKAETASIAANVALLEAKLSQLKAEAALAQASSGGSGGE